ncbi:hypothetical protein D9M72_543690 [compost metagenome]
MPGARKLPPKCAIGGYRLHRLDQCFRLRRIEIEGRLAAGFADRRYVGGQHRAPLCHCFKRRDAEAFVKAREQEGGCLALQPGDLGVRQPS